MITEISRRGSGPLGEQEASTGSDPVKGRTLEASSRRDFLKVLGISGASFLRIGAAVNLFLAACATDVSAKPVETQASEPARATATRQAETATSVEQAAFPEQLKQTLDGWLANQAYDYGYNEPLIKYSKIIREPVQNGGWNVSIETTDGTKQEMFTLVGNELTFQADGETKTVAADRIYAEATPDEGGYFRLRIKKGGESDPAYMWRFPWGGWVTDSLKTFTENGVSIIANEAELFGGLFTINLEQIEEYWEDTIRGMYNVQVVTENTAITGRYPTVDSFLDAARSGKPIEGLRILVSYPVYTPKYEVSASWVEAEGALDLSTVSYGIVQVTVGVIKETHYSNREYLWFDGDLGEVKIQEKTIGGENLVAVYLKRNEVGSNEWFIPLTDNKSLNELDKSAAQLIRSLFYELKNIYFYSPARSSNNKYPNVRTGDVYPPVEERIAMFTTGDSIFLLRP